MVPRCFTRGSACSFQMIHAVAQLNSSMGIGDRTVALRFLIISCFLPGYEAFHTISVSFEKKPEMIKVPCLRRGQGSDPLSWNRLLEGS
jgi:hypothetical protein